MIQALIDRQNGNAESKRWQKTISSQIVKKLELSFKSFHKLCHQRVNCLDNENIDHRYLLSGYGKGEIAIHDLAVADETETFPVVANNGRLHDANCHAYSVNDIQWYPHDTGMFLSLSADHTVKVWDTNEVEVVNHFKFNQEIFSFDLAKRKSCLVAVASKDGNVALCDMKSCSKSHILKGHSGPVLTVKWSPRKENILVSGSRDKQIFVWDVRKVKSFLFAFESEDCNKTAHNGSVNGLHFTGDGLNVISLATDHTMKLWDFSNGQQVMVNYGRIVNSAKRTVHLSVTRDLVKDLVFVPTGYDIDVFELYSGKYIRTLSGHYLDVNCCQFNSSYQELYSGSSDTRLLLWSPKTQITKDEDGYKDAWSDNEV